MTGPLPSGSPIRVPPDRRPCAPPRGLSRLAAPFVVSLRQGIRRAPCISCPRLAAGRHANYSVLFHCVDNSWMSRSGAVERPSRDDATPDSLIMSFVSFAFGSERSLKSQMENRFRESSRVRRGKPPERFLLAMRLSRYAGRTPGTGYRGRGSHRGTGGLLAPGAHRNIRIESLCFLRLLPRKEVIQPHVPVRLPCYDFTPLALHTFDASLTRLGRRLRVQTTRVV